MLRLPRQGISSVEHVPNIRPDIEKVRKNDKKVQKVIKEALKRAWQLLPKKLLILLTKSIKKRVNAIINTKG